MNEAETRAEHIDPALKAAGWGVVEGSRIRREHAIAPGRIEGHGKHGKPLTADYVLEYTETPRLGLTPSVAASSRPWFSRRGCTWEGCLDREDRFACHQRSGVFDEVSGWRACG